MTEAVQTQRSADHGNELVATIVEARANGTALQIRGGNSKQHLLGRGCEGTTLNVSSHSGIVEYQPGELVVTARAGTPIVEIIEALQSEKQMLAFEPPQCGGKATLGGTLACNLSGPARPWSGSIRDHVLGVELINGQAEKLNFGGTVMKNVAGYDVSRLQAGALGTLGVLTEISVKVMPRPEHSLTLRYEVPAAEVVAHMNRRAAEPKPLQGACWFDGQLYLRLAGASSAVTASAQQWGGEQLSLEEEPWEALREWTLPFFAGEEPVWRMSLSATAPLDTNLGLTLIDWGGAQRWIRGEQNLAVLQSSAEKAGGHVVKFRGGDRSAEVRSIPSTVEQRLQKRVKAAFDPDNLLNPGRLYSWL